MGAAALVEMDSVSVEHGRTAGWCDMALEMPRMDGDMKEARLLLRGVLSRVKDYAPIYRVWIDMELDTEHGGDGVRAAWRLFVDWKTALHRASHAACADAKRAADVAKDERVADATKDKLAAKAELAADVAKSERADYWCAYMMFEVQHGTVELARNVAERAAWACPDDDLVLAMCTKVEEMTMALLDEKKRRCDMALAWIDMEMETEHSGDGVGASRRLFEDRETTLRRAANAADADSKHDGDNAENEDAADATKDDLAAKAKLAVDVAKYERADFWCRYIEFEVHHGTAESARNVAEWAVKACPGDELVLAMCVKFQEMVMAVVDEKKRRHRPGLIRGAKKWLGTIFAPTSTHTASRAGS